MSVHVYIAHGASGTSASMKPHVVGLRKRGIEATAIDLPKKKAEDAVPAFRSIVPDGPSVAVAGQSYGGRVASLAAAQPDTSYVALVVFSYPLHPPGKPDEWGRRTSHWASIRCPVLLLSGEADPFANIDLLRKAVRRLRNVELVTYPGLGHTMKPVLDDALDRVVAFLRG
jgi:predicted alpha/beta-hydrolase family hydrolase